MDDIAPERGTVAPGINEAVLACFPTITLLALGAWSYWITCLILSAFLGLLYSKARDTRFDFGIYMKTASFAYIALCFIHIVIAIDDKGG